MLRAATAGGAVGPTLVWKSEVEKEGGERGTPDVRCKTYAHNPSRPLSDAGSACSRLQGVELGAESKRPQESRNEVGPMGGIPFEIAVNKREHPWSRLPIRARHRSDVAYGDGRTVFTNHTPTRGRPGTRLEEAKVEGRRLVRIGRGAAQRSDWK